MQDEIEKQFTSNFIFLSIFGIVMFFSGVLIGSHNEYDPRDCARACGEMRQAMEKSTEKECICRSE